MGPGGPSGKRPPYIAMLALLLIAASSASALPLEEASSEAARRLAAGERAVAERARTTISRWTPQTRFLCAGENIPASTGICNSIISEFIIQITIENDIRVTSIGNVNCLGII